MALNTTVDNSGDVPVITVDSGPADLDVKTTVFSDGTNDWTLGSSNGDYIVQWEFATTSIDGPWYTFLAADPTQYNLADSVPQSDTRNLYLRLTMPTDTTSYEPYSCTVTVVASAP